MPEIQISSRYQGITGIAHGGYVAGLVAGGRPVTVTLRRPPPLESPLQLEEGRLVDGEGSTVMEAHPAGDLDVSLPVVALAEAEGRPPHRRFVGHPYPDCFMCGTARADGFGLRVSAPDRDGMATGVWTPSGPLLPEGAVVAPEFLWAAVDCLTVWSFADRWDEPDWWPAVTGRIVLETDNPVRRDQAHVVAGRLREKDGRKITVDATISNAGGEVCARGRAVWVVVAAESV